MATMLTIGAWAENLWADKNELTTRGFSLVSSIDLSAGDVLTFTVDSLTSKNSCIITLSTISRDEKGKASKGTDLISVTPTVGTVTITVDDSIAIAAKDGLWVSGKKVIITSIDLTRNTTVPPTVSISDAGYATFCYSAPLDLTGIEAYTAAVDGNIVALTSVEGKKIPADTPIILKGSGDVVIPITADATDAITGNDLLVSDGNVTGNGSIYILAKGTSGVGFYQLQSGSTLPKGKAYLQVSASAKVFYGFDDATDINMINASKAETNACYNLNGQRVSANTKGICIVNGKKVIIK